MGTDGPYAWEVAADLGLSFEQLRAECRSRGYGLTSANSQLPLTLADWLRRDLPARPDVPTEQTDLEPAPPDDPGKGAQQWLRAVARAQRLSRETATYQGPKYNRKYPPPALVQAALDHAVVPQRSRSNRRPADVWTVEECDRAERIASSWAGTWLTRSTPNDSDPLEWLRVARGQRPDLAVALSIAGLSPADAELRLDRFGAEDLSARTIMAQVVGGLGVSQAVHAVNRFRSRNAAGA
jgi:hypothetical protein